MRGASATKRLEYAYESYHETRPGRLDTTPTAFVLIRPVRVTTRRAALAYDSSRPRVVSYSSREGLEVPSELALRARAQREASLLLELSGPRTDLGGLEVPGWLAFTSRCKAYTLARLDPSKAPLGG